VLEVVYPGGRVHTDGPQPVCVRVVAPAATVPSAGPGYCADLGDLRMDESPDGSWATFSHDDAIGTVRLADVAAGRWAPTTPARISRWWDSPETFIDTGGLGEDGGYTRCAVGGLCYDLHLQDADIIAVPYGI
jgi:hypothetical protein